MSFRDLWLFNGSQWQVFETGGPAARHDHAASYAAWRKRLGLRRLFEDVEQHRLLLHGGWDGRNIFQDLWQFDTELLSASKVSGS